MPVMEKQAPEIKIAIPITPDQRRLWGLWGPVRFLISQETGQPILLAAQPDLDTDMRMVQE